jgi:hypothetical protein
MFRARSGHEQREICMNREEIKGYLVERFLKGDRQHYICLETDNYELTKSSVMGTLNVKFQIGLKDACDAIDGTFMRPWSGKKVYVPNQPKVVLEKGLYHLNLWKPSKVKPSPNPDSKFFEDFLIRCLGSNEKANFVINFLAYRYQNPINKVPQALYLYGSQGQGKSMFAEIITTVFGQSAVKRVGKTGDINSKGSVNNWGRTFLIGEEIDVPKDSIFYSELKSFTGMSTVEADDKFISFGTYEIPAQLIMLSNKAPSFIEMGDRRFFISEWETGLEGNDKATFFNEFTATLRNGGYESISGLLNNRDLSSYDGFQPPLETEEKKQMMNLSLNPTVQKLICFLDEKTSQRVFEMESFKVIWEEDAILKPEHKKHLLNDAGLKSGKRIRLTEGGSPKSVWIRKEDELIPQDGNKGTLLRLPNGNLVKAAQVYEEIWGEL